ncbi:CaiB/BaiF CoA-transferase family protein [Spirillospora sp. NPDC047418]
MIQPLDGITVVSLEQAVAAPFATRQLADAGARVIKVERPDDDFARGYDRTVHGEASYFVWLNRGKESITLDVKDPADKAVLLALVARADVLVQNLAPGAAERTGEGSTIAVSMLEALGEWASQPACYTFYSDAPWRRTGARHASIAPYGPYQCGDGRLFLGIQNDREWASLCERVLGRPDLVTHPAYAHNPERVANDAEITVLIESALATVSRDEALRLLEDSGIACAALREPQELFSHPQLAARGRWKEVDTPGGTVRALLPPVDVAGWQPAIGPVPALGQHSQRIRDELAETPWGAAQ